MLTRPSEWPEGFARYRSPCRLEWVEMVSDIFKAAKAANPNVPPLLVFDLVATLTDAGPRYAEAYIRMCRAWNVAPPEKSDILAALGNKNLKQIIAEFTPGLPADGIDAFMQECNEACDTLLYDVRWHEDLYPHVRETLHDLRDKGYALGIYTGTREEAVDSQLRYHNITGCFDERFLRGKNNGRDGYMDSDALKAAQLRSIMASYEAAYGLKAGDAKALVTVVGDSVADFTAARQAGLRFIGFAAGHESRRRFHAANPSIAVFDDFRKLRALLSAPLPQSRPSGLNF